MKKKSPAGWKTIGDLGGSDPETAWEIPQSAIAKERLKVYDKVHRVIIGSECDSNGWDSTGNFRMRRIVDVDTGYVMARPSGFILRVNAIGSCIAVAAYDGTAKIAGMAHVMLPGRAPETAGHKTKYAVDAIEHMIELMLQHGAKKSRIEVALIGAGNVLCKKDDTICESNIKSVIATLAETNIPVRTSSLGGRQRRSALLDTCTGCLSYTQGDGPVTLLWQFSDPNN